MCSLSSGNFFSISTSGMYPYIILRCAYTQKFFKSPLSLHSNSFKDGNESVRPLYSELELAFQFMTVNGSIVEKHMILNSDFKNALDFMMTIFMLFVLKD